MSFYITHLGDVPVGRKHKVGVTLSSNQRQTKPQVSFHLRGPNNSPRGHGNKSFPEWMYREWNTWDGRTHSTQPYKRMGNSLNVTLPYIGWNTLYRTRRVLPTCVRRSIGSAQYRFYNRIYKALAPRSNRLCREAQRRMG